MCPSQKGGDVVILSFLRPVSVVRRRHIRAPLGLHGRSNSTLRKRVPLLKGIITRTIPTCPVYSLHCMLGKRCMVPAVASSRLVARCELNFVESNRLRTGLQPPCQVSNRQNRLSLVNQNSGQRGARDFLGSESLPNSTKKPLMSKYLA